MSAEKQPDVIKINNKEISKDLVDEKAKKAYEAFAKKMKENTNNPKEAGEIFWDHAEKVLTGIKQNMLTTFSTIKPEQLKSYEAAKDAFDTDIQKYINEQEKKEKTISKKPTKTKGTTEQTNDDDVYSASPTPEKKENKSIEKQPKENKKIQNLKSLQTITHDIGLIIQLKKLEWNIKTEEVKNYDIEALKKFIKANKELKFKETYITKDGTQKNIFNEIKETQEKAKKETAEKTEKDDKQKTIDQKLNMWTAESFFETDEAAYNAVIEQIMAENNSITSVTINNESTGKAADLYKRVGKYAKISNIWDIKIGRWTNIKDNRFTDNVWVIEYATGNKNSKNEYISGYIVRGTEEHKQKIIAEKNEKAITKEKIDRTKKYWVSKDNTIKIPWESKDKPADTKLVETAINIFDDMGNFQAFDMYINSKTPEETIRTNLSNILTQIKNYKPSTDTASSQEKNITTLQNGYADVMTQYILKHTSDTAMMNIYIDNLTTENLNILGADTATRIKNYNLLVPELKKLENTSAMSKETQKRIIELGITIWAQPKLTPENMLSKGFDALVEQFWPMIFSVLKMFGFGKWSLLKMFWWAKDKINAMYKKEYGLSSEEVKAIDDTIKNIEKEIPNIKDKDGKLTKTQRTGKELKNTFTERTKYIENIQENKNYKYINVATFKTGLDAYNKENKTDLRINDVITITTDEKTKQQSISNIENKENFAKVMNSILDSEATRSKIASANADIMTATTSKIKDRGENEYGKNIDTRYAITSQQDIARYLTASLFSNKDLSYVMTENELHNGKENEVKTLPKKYIVNNPDWINLRDTNEPKKTDEKWLKDWEEITAMLDEKWKEITATASELKLSADDIWAEKTADLNKEIYKKVKTNDGKTRRVAEKFIQEKTAPTETETKKTK